uniref:VHS domain-containing protein n=1 Tax=Poecilia latipinna TaxID=48699 RepID=A0A3B3TVU5_9TELE
CLMVASLPSHSWVNEAVFWDSLRLESLRVEVNICIIIRPQLATRLLAHKIQSPQEWEAMQALLVLETCMKNCGNKFHGEVGKFRFLNELIKVVSQRCWR